MSEPTCTCEAFGDCFAQCPLGIEHKACRWDDECTERASEMYDAYLSEMRAEEVDE